MSLDFKEFFNVLENSDFEEQPVPLETFLYSKDYMGMIPLGNVAEEIIRRGSQIYREHTLISLYGQKEGRRKWLENANELILALGKSAGKDLDSQLICCYIVYQLLCLKDPAGYFGKPAEDNIDIVNVATNAKQANTVFFAGLKTRIKKCPWFAGKYIARSNDIEFNKNIRIHSLNSEGEGTEGLNILVAVLDEIDGFDESDEAPKAHKMYKTLTGTVHSRFEDVGKVLLLSFTRSKKGFMMTHYESCIAEKNVIKRKHTFKLNDDLPDGIEENEFSIEWDEDHIISYKYSKVWAFRRATWEVNFTKTPETFKMDFYRDPDDALARFCCCPTDTSGATWFRNKERVDECFSSPNGLQAPTDDEDVIIQPDPDKTYYMHVDLARVQDNCAVALAHVTSFVQAKWESEQEISPKVKIDLVRYWKPDRTRPIDFSDVRSFIIKLKRLGFNIVLVTFDRWRSDGVIEHLQNVGINADVLSVGPDHYSELALLMGEERIDGPDVELLREELKKLVVLPNGKIEHTSKSSKDLSDAVAGAAYNAATYTPRDDEEVTVLTAQDFHRAPAQKPMNDNVIRKPERTMPEDISDFLSNIKML